MKKEPPFSLIKKFNKATKNTLLPIDKMRKEVIFQDKIFSKKLKATIAALISAYAKCEPCLEFYIQKAKAFGATDEEIGEILAILPTISACIEHMWATKTYRAFHEKNDDSCCS